ncbi:MAG: hypothetical protein C4326_15220 [Ignavibacteria bacterium]
MTGNDIERIKAVKQKHERTWLALDGVVAVGIGTLRSGATGIVISVREDTGALRTKLPEKIEDVEIEIRVSGPLRAL